MIEQFADTIRRAVADQRTLRIRGGGTKDFYGVALDGDVVDTRSHAGVIDYEPSELVVTARAGTSLVDLEAVLASKGQMLAFEPPRLGPDSTIGGVISAGFSGPRRATAGSARDYVLGVKVMNGDGAELRFGGQVMKNVAGYDMSRLMAGACGTLGLLTEVSLKVLPVPRTELTVRLELPEAEAIVTMNRLAGTPLPISATCHHDDVLSVRLSGAEPAVAAARASIGGELVADGADFWQSVRDQRHSHFGRHTTLWRLSLRSTVPPIDLGPTLIEWGGALRWIAGNADPEKIHAAAAAAGGHATLYRGGNKTTGIQRLAPGMLALQQRLKQSLDPHGVFGARRLHPTF